VTDDRVDADAAGPLPVVAYAPDLMDRSRIAAAVPGVVFVRSPDALASTPARLVLLDLSRPGALDALPTVAGRVVGFGSHVDDELLAAARAAGCDEVLPRSRFFRQLERYA
jgi:hypothetical protein